MKMFYNLEARLFLHTFHTIPSSSLSRYHHDPEFSALLNFNDNLMQNSCTDII